MSVGLGISETTQYLHGRDVAVLYRDLITRCARAHSDCYDDEQELASTVVLGLLQYPKPIEYPDQFVRVMSRNFAINRARVGSRYWEVVESEMIDDSQEKALSTVSSNRRTSKDDHFDHIILQDTLVRLEGMLTPAEAKCYGLLKAGLEQADLSDKLGISRQAVSKILKEIRRKFQMVNED